MVHMDKCSKFVRWTLFAFNCLVWLGGSVMVGLGVWVTTQDTEYKHLSGNLYVTITYIVLSSFIFIIGFLGACGILLMKQTLLKVYFALMFVLLMAELGLAIYIYVEKDKLQDHIAENWNKTTDAARIVIQEKLKCCGVKNLEHNSTSHNSCFIDNDPTKEKLKDCYTQLMDWIKKNQIILATCAVVVAVLQMFILGGTCRLISIIESGDRSVKRTRVVPINIQQNLPRQDTSTQVSNGQGNVKGKSDSVQSQQVGAGQVLQRRDSDDFEDGGRGTHGRRKWAKVNPKYNSVLSLLEK